jgi:hypothetical protein
VKKLPLGVGPFPKRGAAGSLGVYPDRGEEITARLKGLLMHLRFDSQTGPDVPTPAKALEQIHSRLADQQALWAEQLARDPAAFALLEPQIHLAFGQLADHLVASLLAHAAARQPLADGAQKK